MGWSLLPTFSWFQGQKSSGRRERERERDGRPAGKIITPTIVLQSRTSSSYLQKAGPCAAALGRTSAVHFGSLFLRLLHSFFVGQLRRTTSRVAVILRRGQHSFGPAQGFCLVAEAEEKFTPGARV